MLRSHHRLAGAGPYRAFRCVAVRVGAKADSVERKSAQLLAARLSEASRTEVRIEQEGAVSRQLANCLLVLLGVPAHHAELERRLDACWIKPLTERDPGPEGFLVRSCMDANPPCIIAAGVDQRGVLYAVGEILRRTVVGERSLRVPQNLEVRTAPAFEVRGTQYGQSGFAKQLAKVRDWTDDETQRVILDYALAGANTFTTGWGPMFDFIKSYGLMTQYEYFPNAGSGPAAWEAKESIGRKGYVCLSVPEARRAQLERCEAFFSDGEAFDFVKFQGGDGGGCECDRCKPYGLTFIKLVEDMAAVIHKRHPQTRVWFTNQKFNNDDDIAIFEYLQEKPREWLWAWGYGPGSDAMTWQPGHRQTHRMDLFRYPGFGPPDRYNQEIMRQLPPRQVLMHYNEITHWRYSEFGYILAYPRADRDGNLPPRWNRFIYERRPDQALTMVYDRASWFAWPRYYHWAFGEVVRYGAGDVTHSSGFHDHFNQWMWQRLLWAPQTSVEEVVAEYCRAWFGPTAAPRMARALFQLEENLQENPGVPITEKEGIQRYYDLVKQAGERIPRHQMKGHWLWRLYTQKGALDLYIRHSVRQQADLQRQIERTIARALEDGDLDQTVDLILPWFDQLEETPEMRRLREEAAHLGEESNALFGARNEGCFNLKHDFIGLGWLKRQLQRARAASLADKREMLHMIVAYEDAGEGGFYDNCGVPGPCPHLTNGYPFEFEQPRFERLLWEGNRPSQRSMHYTQDEARGVMFHYRDLDPEAQYRIRFTFVRPWYLERYASRMNQKSQTIYANEFVLAREVELRLQMSDFCTFDIPREATRQGELVIRLEKAPDVGVGDRVTVEQWRNCGGWGTIVSEVWLMKKK